MTASDVIADLRLIASQDWNVIFTYLSGRVSLGEIRLRNGNRLHDATDFAEFLLELAAVSASEVHKPPLVAGPRIVRQVQTRWERTCHACGHVHESESECGVSMGGGGYCRCDSVTA